MKRTALCLVLCWAALQVWAAEGEWLTDFSKAKEKAKAGQKLVLLDFTGSDWCPPCKALHKNVLTTSDFTDYAKKNLVLVEVDFPRRKELPAELKKANRELADKFNVKAYPTIIVLNAEGKELGRDTGYSGESPKEFIAKVDGWKKKA